MISGRFSAILLSEDETMRNRLLGCISGGLLGFALSGTLMETLGLSGTVGTAFCVVAGVALGYAVGVLIDAFKAKPDSLLPGQLD